MGPAAGGGTCHDGAGRPPSCWLAHCRPPWSRHSVVLCQAGALGRAAVLQVAPHWALAARTAGRLPSSRPSPPSHLFRAWKLALLFCPLITHLTLKSATRLRTAFSPRALPALIVVSEMVHSMAWECIPLLRSLQHPTLVSVDLSCLHAKALGVRPAATHSFFLQNMYVSTRHGCTCTYPRVH